MEKTVAFALLLIVVGSLLSKPLKPCAGKTCPGFALDFPPVLEGGLLRVLDRGSGLSPGYSSLQPNADARGGGHTGRHELTLLDDRSKAQDSGEQDGNREEDDGLIQMDTSNQPVQRHRRRHPVLTLLLWVMGPRYPISQRVLHAPGPLVGSSADPREAAPPAAGRAGQKSHLILQNNGPALDGTGPAE